MIRKSTLDNGIRVVTEQVAGVHSATVGAWVETGSRHETPEQNGISHFVEHMLFKGTERRSAKDIAREIDSVGGVLNAFTGREFSCYYAKVLSPRLPLAIDLLADIALHSLFDLDELEKERKVILQEIYMVEDAPEDLVHDLFTQNFWPGHPLGRPILGSRESVGSLSRGDLVRFVEQRYRGGNILICAAGELEHERVLEQVGEFFAGLGGGVAPGLTQAPVCQRGVDIIEKDLEQVHLCLGSSALPQNHPDRFALHLLNNILGGSMSSRLFQSIREDLGLAYSTYSYLNCHSDTGSLVLYAGTSPEEARSVLHLMLKELRRLTTELVSEQELQATQEQLKGHLLLSLESTDNRMTRLARNELYLGKNPPLREVVQGFEKVTREDILRLGQSLFRDEQLHLQVVGKLPQADITPLDLTVG
ncbi:peptidase M16 [Desulfuromonas versatilis]|uniref:Peptidase M16 n=1 Tax=Desulfuromonas versatilis TaxID=2802975 RepID=A0ABN6E048_9BACT|nr:pitrilysin family protein [Desulfuromonas versatilis]BCR04834.1 peptidase M16 [Desulfuromonas versatilis]